jgi:signal transduction histidine kinase
MVRLPAFVSPAVHTTGDEAPDARLAGRPLLLVRAGWVALALLTLSHLVFSLPALSARFQAVCATCLLTPSIADELRVLRLSAEAFAAYLLVLAVLFSAGFISVGAAIFWRRSDDRMAAFVAVALVAFGGTAFGGPVDGLTGRSDVWRLIVTGIYVFGQVSIFLFFYLFPDGRFTPRWTWIPASVGALLECWIILFADPASFRWRSALSIPIFALVFGIGVYAQVYKYRRVSSQVQRQQTKWVVLGMALAVLAQGMELVIFGLQGPHVLVLLLGNTAVTLAFLLIPLAIGVAILRYRLFDIDLLINRTLVYGSLTTGIIALYIVIVGSLSALFQGRGNILISLLATGVVAVIFQPLRAWLQNSVNRLFYGQRDEPYAVISRLSRRLEATFAPDAVLPAIVETVAQALKLPYAAISISEGGQDNIVSSYGTPTHTSSRLPLVYQAEAVGELILAPRDPGESWTLADRRLLEEVARHAGIAVHAAQLTTALQRANRRLTEARERLVTAREEERRRLRRDLHDGLGPSLAALTLKLGAARKLLQRDQAAADALLAELTADVEDTVGDIRRLVYALRPPTLDELGLMGAIRDQAARYAVAGEGGRSDGLLVLVDAPERLPTLPAATEVAVYRIAQESLTNVVRHAQAHTCRIRLAFRDALELEVTDDGIGLPPQHRDGVGLSAMRERADELGGTCAVEPISTGGTRVLARFPVAMEERDAR